MAGTVIERPGSQLTEDFVGTALVPDFVPDDLLDSRPPEADAASPRRRVRRVTRSTRAGPKVLAAVLLVCALIATALTVALSPADPAGEPPVQPASAVTAATEAAGAGAPSACPPNPLGVLRLCPGGVSDGGR